MNEARDGGEISYVLALTARMAEAQNRATRDYLEQRRFWGADIPRPWHWRAKRAVMRWQGRIRRRVALWIAPELEDY